MNILGDVLYEKYDSLEKFYRMLYPTDVDQRLMAIQFFENEGVRNNNPKSSKALHAHSVYVKNQIAFMKNQFKFFDNLSTILMDDQ